jgi:hypothetical protein
LSEHSKTASRGAAASLATIFVVEDDADLGLALRQFLEEEVPCRVVLSPDGFAALKLVRSIIPHLFLLDYNLPGMNGLELVDHLRATPQRGTHSHHPHECAYAAGGGLGVCSPSPFASRRSCVWCASSYPGDEPLSLAGVVRRKLL